MILWEGESEYTGEPVVVIITGLYTKSQNTKTGNMAQIWVLAQDIAPNVARKTGEDVHTCGDCPLRAGNGCYVNVGQAPLSVWKKYRRGGYGHAPNSLKITKRVRLGAYGDFGALPPSAVVRVLGMCVAGYTGYTHAWRTRPDLRRCCMASVHSHEERWEAHCKWWRTFRTGGTVDQLDTGEINCPSDQISCEKCGMCDGAGSHVKSIFIPAHGSGAKKVEALA